MAEVKVGKIIPPELVEFLREEERAYQEKHPLRKRMRSRVMPEEALCLSKTLSANEVGDGGRLFLNAHEAGLLISCPEIGDKYPLGTLLEYFTVYDVDCRKYDMMFSHSKSDDGEIVYTVYGGWQRFVRTHKLKAGDLVSFYRAAARPKNDNHYYLCIMYTRFCVP